MWDIIISILVLLCFEGLHDFLSVHQVCHVLCNGLCHGEDCSLEYQALLDAYVCVHSSRGKRKYIPPTVVLF